MPLIKLQFKVSQSTTLERRDIIHKISSTLELQDYNITNLTTDLVEFNESIFKLMWNFEAVKRFDGGRLQVIETDNLRCVTFSYYRSITWPLIILIIISISLINSGDYYGPLFFLLFYIIAITVNMVQLRTTAKEMLNEMSG